MGFSARIAFEHIFWVQRQQIARDKEKVCGFDFLEIDIYFSDASALNPWINRVSANPKKGGQGMVKLLLILAMVILAILTPAMAF